MNSQACGLMMHNLSPIKYRNRNTVSLSDTIIGIDDSDDHESNARKLTEVALASDNMLENRIYKYMSQFISPMNGVGFLATRR
jgi:hypothetical protein